MKIRRIYSGHYEVTNSAGAPFTISRNTEGPERGQWRVYEACPFEGVFLEDTYVDDFSSLKAAKEAVELPHFTAEPWTM